MNFPVICFELVESYNFRKFLTQRMYQPIKSPNKSRETTKKSSFGFGKTSAHLPLSAVFQA